MPEKISEEKANLAKKLAEQRAKGVEGIPTTAKVKYQPSTNTVFFLLIYSYLFKSPA